MEEKDNAKHQNHRTDETITAIGYTDDGGYYVCPVRPYMYATYGGIGIDQQGHVLTEDDAVIPGLYAAGEVAGSVDYLATGIYSGQLGQGMQQAIIAARTVTEEIQ